MGEFHLLVEETTVGSTCFMMSTGHVCVKRLVLKDTDHELLVVGDGETGHGCSAHPS